MVNFNITIAIPATDPALWVPEDSPAGDDVMAQPAQNKSRSMVLGMSKSILDLFHKSICLQGINFDLLIDRTSIPHG